MSGFPSICVYLLPNGVLISFVTSGYFYISLYYGCMVVTHIARSVRINRVKACQSFSLSVEHGKLIFPCMPVQA